MFILTLGVFGILNTEMGVVGIIPIIAETFGVTVPDAGWTVSLFALIIAFSAPVVPLLFSRVNRKTVMVLALSVFVIFNLVSVFTTNFTVLLITRAIPAFFHPLYVSIAFSTAASSVSREDAPKAVSKARMWSARFGKQCCHAEIQRHRLPPRFGTADPRGNRSSAWKTPLRPAPAPEGCSVGSPDSSGTSFLRGGTVSASG